MKKAEAGIGSLLASSAGAARELIKPENTSRPQDLCRACYSSVEPEQVAQGPGDGERHSGNGCAPSDRRAEARIRG